MIGFALRYPVYRSRCRRTRYCCSRTPSGRSVWLSGGIFTYHHPVSQESMDAYKGGTREKEDSQERTYDVWHVREGNHITSWVSRFEPAFIFRLVPMKYCFSNAFRYCIHTLCPGASFSLPFFITKRKVLQQLSFSAQFTFSFIWCCGTGIACGVTPEVQSDRWILITLRQRSACTKNWQMCTCCYWKGQGTTTDELESL